jgi:hypothetical protein
VADEIDRLARERDRGYIRSGRSNYGKVSMSRAEVVTDILWAFSWRAVES